MSQHVKDEIAKERAKHLAKVAGITVEGTFDESKNAYYFVFKRQIRLIAGIGESDIYAAYTYPKALAFAEGYNLGKSNIEILF